MEKIELKGVVNFFSGDFNPVDNNPYIFDEKNTIQSLELLKKCSLFY